MKIFFLLSLFFIQTSSEKIYQKNYFDNGKMKSEGWMKNKEKVDYWFFYYENGNKKEEGHYKNNEKYNWWIIYDKNGEVLKKCEFKKNELNGFTIHYEEDDISFVEKFSKNKLVKKWISVKDFKKDNPNLF